MTTYINVLHNNNVIVRALVMDGYSSNLAACRRLGYSLNPDDPIVMKEFNGEPCYLFIDYCHCMKNIRNCFAQEGILFDDDAKELNWEYVERLFKIQKEEGLHLANKLTQDHIYFENQKMKVFLSVQVCSNKTKYQENACHFVNPFTVFYYFLNKLKVIRVFIKTEKIVNF